MLVLFACLDKISKKEKNVRRYIIRDRSYLFMIDYFIIVPCILLILSLVFGKRLSESQDKLIRSIVIILLLVIVNVKKSG